MALAGTLPASRQNYHDAAFWPAKHVREQALVAQYIRQMLQELNINVEQGSIGVKQMQQLLHLCTDFYFDLPDKVTLPQLINKLHPTPAVGGLPKAEALHLIAEAEKNERRYYAGFMGEYRQKGKTVLFVTLRCVEILAKTLIFHAGGGLLTESNAEDEWEETCRKIATIASNLH